MYHQRFKTAKQRFEEKVNKTEGCWEWSGSISTGGYGMMYYQGKTRRAHAVAKSIYDGFPIDSNAPDRKLQWDHLCRNRKCVRPDHLELVAVKVNCIRGESPAAKNYVKTHCPNGHDLAIHSNPSRLKLLGVRSCIICHRARAKRYGAKRRAKEAENGKQKAM